MFIWTLLKKINQIGWFSLSEGAKNCRWLHRSINTYMLIFEGAPPSATWRYHGNHNYVRTYSITMKFAQCIGNDWRYFLWKFHFDTVKIVEMTSPVHLFIDHPSYIWKVMQYIALRIMALNSLHWLMQGEFITTKDCFQSRTRLNPI